MLEAEGLQVLSAKSGMEALELLNQHQEIDIVLLDIMMPEMDGYEVLRRIRSNVRLKTMPVITVTAKAMVGDKEKCLEAGATGYLSKPVDRQTLLNGILLHIKTLEHTV
jgi:two-component system chemotaxis sensor kinase CheA